MDPTKTTDEEGWITWNGGECPVPGETMVEVRLNRPAIEGDDEPTRADHLNWVHFGTRYDITAYRVVDPAPEPAAARRMKLSEVVALSASLSMHRRTREVLAEEAAETTREISRITAKLTALGIEVDE